MKRALRLDPKDNTAVAIDDIKLGEEVSVGTDVIVAKNDIDTPHKIAIADIKTGDDVIKYGKILGYATQDISKGEHVHIHNVDSEKLMK